MHIKVLGATTRKRGTRIPGSLYLTDGVNIYITISKSGEIITGAALGIADEHTEELFVYTQKKVEVNLPAAQ